MQKDFHYYATYCAASLAGYTHDECMEICYSAQFVDLCSETLLRKIKAPKEAATTQLQLELMDMKTDISGLQKITRIWSSFHFLPYDLHAERKHATKMYLDKYRLICDTNSDLLVETIKLAKDKSLPAVGLAMHVLADTWAHRYFAGTPSFVINNTDFYFYELIPGEDGFTERPVQFRHNPSAPDDPEKGIYTNSIHQSSETSVMNLGHGRAGHLPDYSYARYKYMPAWADYGEILKDNPSDYMNAFCQMIYAMKYLRGMNDSFDEEPVYSDSYFSISKSSISFPEIFSPRLFQSSHASICLFSRMVCISSFHGATASVSYLFFSKESFIPRRYFIA